MYDVGFCLWIIIYPPERPLWVILDNTRSTKWVSVHYAKKLQASPLMIIC